jgi:hypothetical protein
MIPRFWADYYIHIYLHPLSGAGNEDVSGE